MARRISLLAVLCALAGSWTGAASAADTILVKFAHPATATAKVDRSATPVRLRYRVHDDGGRTSERVLVYRGKRVVKTLRRPLRTTDAAVAYWVSFSFAARGPYRYCVRATDAAGNHRRLACAKIRIR